LPTKSDAADFDRDYDRHFPIENRNPAESIGQSA